MLRRILSTAILSLALVAVACGPSETTDGGEDTGTTNPDAESDAGDVDDSTPSDAESDAVGDRDGGDEDGGGESDADAGGGGEDGGTPDGAGADADVGPDGGSCKKDTDSDGLTDCEEANLCTDPTSGDTDGDGLSDLEEFQHQTDPCSKDTDNDGATDKEEMKYDLDPKSVSTFNDGVKDGDRWILTACDNPQAEPVKFYKSRTGNWTMALPPSFGNYTELTLTNTSKPEASAVYDDPANEVAGYLLSKKAKSTQSGPVDALRNDVISNIRSVGQIVQDSTGGSFDTHDHKTAAIGRYLVKVTTKKSTRKVRDDLLFQMAPFQRSDASGLPNSSGTRYNKFQVFVSVIFRKNSQGRDQSLISLSVAPKTKYDSIDRVRFRMDDLTNTTNISEQVDKHLVKCATFQPGQGTPRAEFYWVLDQSGSMNDDNQKVAKFASQFEQEVRNTSLAYRLGVTNMDKGNDGHLRVPPGWHKNGSTFKKEIQDAVINCSFGGSWQCSGGSEHGLQAAKRGIKYMTGNAPTQPTPAERIRGQSNVITIFMSDEEANSVKRGSKTAQDFIPYFKGRTIAFAIVGNGTSCGTDDGKAYKDVALATGGKIASLCANNLKKTIRDIIFAATGLASNYKLPQTPISSSLRVYLNGTWVPRSRDDGFEYFAENNSIAFFGKFRPDTKKGSNKPNDYVAVSYETFKDRCKQNNQGSNNCSNMSP